MYTTLSEARVAPDRGGYMYAIVTVSIAMGLAAPTNFALAIVWGCARRSAGRLVGDIAYWLLLYMFFDSMHTR